MSPFFPNSDAEQRALFADVLRRRTEPQKQQAAPEDGSRLDYCRGGLKATLMVVSTSTGWLFSSYGRYVHCLTAFKAA